MPSGFTTQRALQQRVLGGCCAAGCVRRARSASESTKAILLGLSREAEAEVCQLALVERGSGDAARTDPGVSGIPPQWPPAADRTRRAGADAGAGVLRLQVDQMD